MNFLPPDKCRHAAAGALLALLILFAARLLALPTEKAMVLAFVAALVLGVLIEARQSALNAAAAARGEAPGHEVSKADVAATSAGGLVLALAFGLGSLWR